MFSSAFFSLAVFAAAAQAGKRGLSSPWYNAPLDLTLFDGDEVVAIYDWETYAPPSKNGIGNLEFIGTQRCTDCPSSPINQLSSRAQDQGWETVFTLNEPDTNGISPSEAASWYIKNINPLSTKNKALPAVTNSNAPGQGLEWLAQMISNCAGHCDFDYINLHWYGSSFVDFQSYIECANAEFPDYQIVLTEFALQNPSGGQADQITFFKQAFAFLDSLSYVELYFPFLASSPSLLEQYDSSAASGLGTAECLYNNDGTLSAAGQLMLVSSF